MILLILKLILKYIYDCYLNFNGIISSFLIFFDFFFQLIHSYYYCLCYFLIYFISTNIWYRTPPIIIKHILFLFFSFIVLFFQVIYLIDLNFMLFLILLPAYYWLYSKHNLTVLANPVLTWFHLILILFLHFSILFYFSSSYWSQF